MKQAILLHGTGGSGTDYFWFADTKQYLESNGYSVWWQEMPNTNSPKSAETLAFLGQSLPELNDETILIGHSSSCPIILQLLQDQEKTVRQIILVAGYYQPIPEHGVSGNMLPDAFDWDKIKQAVNEIILINSDNDPYGCTDVQARPVALNLDAKLIVNTGQAHMGANKFNQPYVEFPLLKKLIDL